MNFATIATVVVLLVICFLVIRSMVKNKNNGKGNCGCGGECGSCKGCHK